MDPFSFGFVRAAVISPELRVADVEFNVAEIAAALRRALSEGVALALFPELSVTGYTCGDLFYQSLLLERARGALKTLAQVTAELQIAAVVGLPLLQDGKIYNCAAFLNAGDLLGIVPKTYLPNTQEYYEARWFTSSRYALFDTVDVDGARVPFGADLIFRATNVPGCVVGIEICEDLWAINAPSSDKALAGATILLNPSASDDTLGKSEYRTDLVTHQSGRCLAAYLYAGTSANESTTDVVFAGHCLIAENGTELAITERFHFDTQMAIADVDVERLINERIKNTSFSTQTPTRRYRTVEFELPAPRRDVPVERLDGDVSPERSHGDVSPERSHGDVSPERSHGDVSPERSHGDVSPKRSHGDVSPERSHGDVSPERSQGDVSPKRLYRPLSRTPFVPGDPERRALHCREIFALQSTGLAKRLKHTGVKNVTIGISGGLDSTLALLVTIKAYDTLGLDHRGIVAISMPGFGTTARTKSNAEQLAAQLGITFRTIPITDAVRQHFRDIGHDEKVHDVTYENAQARERTQILMDVANQIEGLVVGTGDLSELALGWATYNGDQMSMYHVNAGVPKTLVRYLIEWAAESEFRGEPARILHDIVATPITPELLPLDAEGKLQQETEATIGPYILHDFFLFHIIRRQFAPRKIFFLAQQAFCANNGADEYDAPTILKWLGVFYRRFFSQQFKRSAMPDGPKVGSVALSPRGDWRMPSDASAALWLAEVAVLTGSSDSGPGLGRGGSSK
ncbi:MAG: NAD(+) synthase [Chloroflexi bacterium]|nr:NAD(+) synthase [Chloroflexota bacterium]